MIDDVDLTVCAGIPRSGTTYLFRALAGLPAGNTTPVDYAGPIVKTHSPEPGTFASAKRALFVFGDPIAAVISTRLHRYQRQHFSRCGAPDLDPETFDIYRQDGLNYERMFDAWTRRQASFDVLCLRYETIAHYENLISDFMGRRVTLFDFRPRSTNVETAVGADELAAIRTTYAKLVAKVETSPDAAVFSARLPSARTDR